MTKNEFEVRLNGKKVSNEDYAIIEKVYTFHPLINENGGKEQIAQFYLLGGMRLIKDMIPTAEKAAEIENEIMHHRNEIEEARRNLDEAMRKLADLAK